MENLVHEDLLKNLQISAAVGLEQRADGVHALYTPREAVGEQPLAPPHDVHQACTVTHVKVELVFLCVELLHTLLLLQVEVLWVDCRLRTAHSTTVERLLHLHRQALRHLRELRLVQQRRVGRNGSDACSLGGGLGFLQECHTTCQVNMWCSSMAHRPRACWHATHLRLWVDAGSIDGGLDALDERVQHLDVHVRLGGGGHRLKDGTQDTVKQRRQHGTLTALQRIVGTLDEG